MQIETREKEPLPTEEFVKENVQDEMQDDLLRKRERQGSLELKSTRVSMPSNKGPFISKEEFMNYQKETLLDSVVDKYYEKYYQSYYKNKISNYIDHYKEVEWFKDFYHLQTRTKIGKARNDNNKKKHEQFLKHFNTEKADQLDISIGGVDGLTDDESSLRVLRDISKTKIEERLRKLYNPNTKVITKYPKSLSIIDLFTTFTETDWFFDVQMNYPLKYNNFERFMFLNINPFIEEDQIPTEIELKNYSFELSPYPSYYFTVYVKKYKNAEEVVNDLSYMIQLIKTIFENNSIDGTQFNSFFSTVKENKRLDLLIYYLQVVWGINPFNKSINSIETSPSIILLNNSSTFQDIGEIPNNTETTLNNDPLFKEFNNKDVEPNLQDKIEEQLTKVLDPQISVLEDDIRGCFKCEKLFKNLSYVIKHMKQKHKEKIEQYCEDIKDSLVWQRFKESKMKDVLIGNFKDKLNFKTFNEHIVDRELEKVKVMQSKARNYRWKLIHEYNSI